MLGDRPVQPRVPRLIPPNAEEQLEELRNWYPDSRDRPDSGTFEIALVLAGAVSAGAYTAGVMDFLFEALDQWYTHRLADDDLPNHRVVLRAITGASAGGINGAIAAAACRYRFPPVTLDNAQENGPRNPFFDAWVTGIDVHRLLDTSDLEEDSPIHSLLNSQSLDALALGIVDMSGDADANRTTRAWLADPFKLLLTVTNLRGVPYTVRFSGGTRFDHEMLMHQDHVGFSVPVLTDSPGDAQPPPDLVPLIPVNSANDPGWRTLAVTALASGAFPLALAARSLSRPGSDYDYRFVFPHANRHVVYSEPKIDRRAPYRYTAVDGGTMNNEPFELARVELAGMNDRNPRRGHEACRAVIMVDPFTDLVGDPPLPETSLWATFRALLKAFKAQSRFKQVDLTLAEAEDVYSRFMIAPSRKNNRSGGTVRGSSALASGGLRSFLGFFCKDYRLHDYMLGRENCQRFLRDWFVLPSEQTTTRNGAKTDNALFAHWPQSALDNDGYKSLSPLRKGHRQIIPLVGTAASEQTLPPWPAGKFGGYDQVKRAIEKRIDAAYPPLANEITTAFCEGTSTFSWLN